MSLQSSVYGEVPAPESELLALVHTMLSRGLVAERELSEPHADRSIAA